MAFIDKLLKFFKEDQVKRLAIALDQAHTGEARQLIVPETHYFRIRLVEMFITKKTWMGKTWYPAAHGLVKAAYGDQVVELPSVADTSKLFQEQGGTGDVVARNFALTPLLPYRGGTVDLVCGLFAMQGENYLGKMIKVLSDFSGLLAVPQVSQVLNIAAPLASGVQDLFGATDGRMHLGYHDQWVSVDDPDHPADNALRSGYIAIIRGSENNVDASALRVEKQQLRIVDGAATRPYTGKDHLLLHIESRSERDDLSRLSNFWQPFKDSLDALANAEDDKAKASIRQAIAAARTSHDLTDADRSRVTARLKKLYIEARDDMNFAGLVDDDTPLVDRMRLQGTPEAALAAGVPTLDELWDGI